ncbi:MAG: AI-2E family transporter [Phycisphaerae bacterium]|nr:AI-2E family transporter [Phycisphaerae bacterium]
MGLAEHTTPASTHSGGGLSGPSRFLITAAAFVVVIAGMRAAAAVIVPFLLSVFLAIISTPALFWLKNRGISGVWAILLVSGVILLAGLLVGTVLTASVADFTQDLPMYAAKLNDEAAKLEQKWKVWMEKIHSDFSRHHHNNGQEENPSFSQTASDSIFNEASNSDNPQGLTQFLDTRLIIRLMRDLLGQLGSIAANGFMIYLTTVFILLEASILPGKIKTVMKNNPKAFDNLASAAGDVKKYLALKTIISLATGILIAIWLIVLGVKYPIVWGLIAFLLNFVPNIGSIAAAIPACLLALVQIGPVSAGLAVLGYLAVNITIGNIIEPRVMGQRMGLSTLVVFLSLVFWGWVLGPVGMLLSVPLTMTLKIVLQSHPDTCALALLLGSQNPRSEQTEKLSAKKR